MMLSGEQKRLLIEAASIVDHGCIDCCWMVLGTLKEAFPDEDWDAEVEQHDKAGHYPLSKFLEEVKARR